MRPSLPLLLVFFFCFFASSTRAPAAQSPQTTAPAAQTSDAKPSQQTQPSQTSDKPASQPNPKKVWTNEDVGELRERSTISTVGTQNRAPANNSERPVRAASPQLSKWYHDQIASLQQKIPPLDAKIGELQDALSGKQVNETRKVWWATADDWHDQLARLQKQRDQIVARISALEDEARHKGVPENALR